MPGAGVVHEVHGSKTLYYTHLHGKSEATFDHCSKVTSIFSTVSTGNSQYKLVRDNIEHNSCAMINGLANECDLTV